MQQRILLYGGNLWYLGEGMLGPLFAVFAGKIGGDVLDIAWAWSAYLFATGVMSVAASRLADARRNQARMMIVGYALNAACTFGYFLVSSPWHLLLVQLGLGAANALATPTWNALYARFRDGHADTAAWGAADGMANMTVGVAVLIGGLIVSYASFEILFLVMGTVQVIATVYQARILRYAE